MEDASMKSVLEMMLFLSGDPVMPAEMKEVTELHENEIADLMDELTADYAARGGGMLIGKIAGGYQIYSNPALAKWARKYKGSGKPQKLSVPALEALAIIAYRQPITKLEIEELRGANSDGVVKNLLDRGLVKIVGKKEAPGKPLLYGTTREFLQYFGLKDLTDMPTLKDLEREEAA